MENIVWLCKDSKNMSTDELFNWLSDICKPVQTGIIMNHISLLDENMLIGYDKTNDDVYVMIVNDDIDNEIIKISKKV